jgi:hypothetical protein
MDQNQTRTWSWYGKAIYEKSIEYLKARTKKWGKLIYQTDEQTEKVQALPKSHMHIFNVYITIVQSLKNVRQMV